MASMWPPKKNTAFTLSFTLYKNDGTIVANPGTYTKKVSTDGALVGNIAASVTEEDTTYGQLSLVLSADEMNGDWIWVYITDDTAGTVPFTCTLYTVASTQDDIGTNIAAILVDTGTTLDGRIPAALVGGKMDSHVNDIAAGAITATAIAANAIDADAIATDAGAEIADAVWDEAIAGHAGAGSTGEALSSASAPSAASVADAVWDEAIAGHLTAGSTGNKLNTASAAAGAGGISWTYTLTSSVDATPIADADVWVTSDLAGTNVLASGKTNQSGAVTFMLDAGTVYVFCQKTGWNFTNPDTEVVS